jgi:hypothetical protein
MKQFLFILFFFSLNTQAQITFQKIYGDVGEEKASYINKTNDEGYIITGSTNSFGAGGHDVYLIKTDSLGNLLWSKTYGGSGTDFGYYVKQTTDNGYIIGGYTESFGAILKDAFIIKTDSNGNLLWSKMFGEGLSEYCYAVDETSDGRYVLVYSKGLIKVDSIGNLVWSKKYNANLYFFQKTNDEGFILVGDKDSSVAYNQACLIKTDSSGNILWSKKYFDGETGYGKSVIQTSDGGYMSTGYTRLISSSAIVGHIIKTDSSGNLIWLKQFSNPNGSSHGWSVIETDDGGFAISGDAYHYPPNTEDSYLMKLSSNGNLIWSRRIGTLVGDERGYSLVQDNMSRYLITGFTWGFGSSDIYLIRTDTIGISGCNEDIPVTTIDSPVSTAVDFATIVSIPSLVITTPSPIVTSGGIVTTLCPIPTGINESGDKKNTFSLFPNPTTNELRIENADLPAGQAGLKIKEIEIYSSLGEKIISQISSLKSQISVDVSQLSPGIYFITVTDQVGNKVTRKVVKMRGK